MFNQHDAYTKSNNFKNIFILSLGQIIHSDQKKSILAFGKLLLDQSKYFPYFTAQRIYFSLLLDVLWYGTIDSYKKGNIQFDEFKNRLCNQIGIKITDGQFKVAWNAMATVSLEAANKIVDIISKQQNQDFTLVIVTSSNEVQYNHIIEQINKKLEEKNLPLINHNSSISIINSFEEHELSLSKLARKLIMQKNYDNEDNQIISLHNKLTKEVLEIKKAAFCSFPSTSSPFSWYENMKKEIQNLPQPAKEDSNIILELNTEQVDKLKASRDNKIIARQ